MVFTEKTWAQYTQDARVWINQLASTEFKGRGYTGGDSLAAFYIASELKKAGIGHLDGGYFQNFSLDANTFPQEISLTFNNTRLIPGKDFVLSPWSGSLNGKYKYVTLNKENLLTDEAIAQFLLKNKNKLIVLDTFKIRFNNQIISTRNFAMANIAENVGYIMLDEGQPIFGAASFSVNHFSASVRRSAVSKAKGKLKVSVTNDLKKNYTTRNVIGYIPGSTDTCILLTAHYDHLGQLGPNVFYAGAHDNASGVAAITSLGKILAQQKPHYSYLLVYFSGEESGLLGSVFFVNNSPIKLSKIKMVLNLDLAGSGDQGISVVNGKTHPDVVAVFDSINKKNNYFPVINVRGPAANSDHHPFHEKNIKSVFIYTMGEYKAYHIPEDNAENIPLTKFNELILFVWDYLCTEDKGLQLSNE